MIEMKRFAFATALLLAPLTSIACKCIDYAVYLENSGAARGLLDSKNVVVFQGRVKEVGTHATKEIDVIRWISGAEISRVWAQRGPAEMCGTSFVSG